MAAAAHRDEGQRIDEALLRGLEHEQRVDADHGRAQRPREGAGALQLALLLAISGAVGQRRLRVRGLQLRGREA